MPVQINVGNPSVDHQHNAISEPDEKNVYWSDIHDMKVQIRAVLIEVLKSLHITNVPILNDGALQYSSLTDEEGKPRTVITIGRTSDVTLRRAIGDKIISTIGGSNLLCDPDGNIAEGTPVDVYGEWSVEGVDITIADLDSQIANTMYRVVKYIMIMCGVEMRKLGYEDFKRSNGVDQTVQIDAPGSGLVYMKVLSYTGTHRDEVISLPQIAKLVAQRQTIQPRVAENGTTVVSGL